MLNEIWVSAELDGGIASVSTRELVSWAASLAQEVVAFVAGSELEANVVDQLGECGATRAICVDGGSSLPSGGVLALGMYEEIQQGSAPSAIFFEDSHQGRDAASRLSAKLNVPVVSNVVGLSIDDGRIIAHNTIFGAKEQVSTVIVGPDPSLFVIKAKSFEIDSHPKVCEVKVVDVTKLLGHLDRVKIINSFREERTGPKLADADIVVAGGRGIGSAENFHLIEELAELLGGAVGASRAIVDSGWVPYSLQVGQTGKSVTPSLYFAIGISGATQHIVGMKGARSIIAINKDRTAPIFSISDLGVVGDVHTVLPSLIDALKARRSPT